MRTWMVILLILALGLAAGTALAGTVEDECGLALLFRHSVPQWTTCFFAILADVSGDLWWGIYL